MKQTISKNVASILFLLFISISSFGQNAKVLMKKADAFYDAQAYELAIPVYRDVLLTENSLAAKTKLADCYRLTNDYDKAEYWYAQLVNIVPNQPQYKLYYAQMLQSNEKYEEAYKWFMEYGKFDVWGEKLASGCQNVESFKQTDNKYEVLLLPLNSEGSDFGPIYFQNGIIFCSNGNNSNDKERTFMDLYYSDVKLGNSFSPPQKVDGNVNSRLNDGPASFSNTTNELFFSRNATIGEDGKIQNDSEAAINLSLFTTKQNNGKWGEIKPFMHNSPTYSIAHAAISADGKNLYFASNMPGGFGGTDLYTCIRVGGEVWSKPVNLGKTVNTPGNEAFPYVHSDGLLYFASNGHPGLGGLDIFTSQNKDGFWTQPKNLGAPFNSSKDDFSITMSSSKNKGYFSSNRPGGFGSDDIYSFALIGSEKRVKAVEQPPISNTIINQSIGMGTVRFKRGDAEILPDAAKELDKLAFFLQKNPEVTVELSSHTDIRGDDFNNLDLSARRSKAARDYVVSRGVPLHRVVARGYGESQILNDCVTVRSCDESEHEINNRIDVRVLSIEGINDDPYSAYMSDNNGKTLDIKKSSNELTFKVLIGPYRSVDNSTYYKFSELNTTLDLEYTDAGMMIVLGPYQSIAKAEEFQGLALNNGADKAEVVAFEGDKRSTKTIKQLKKQGVN